MQKALENHLRTVEQLNFMKNVGLEDGSSRRA